MAHLASLKSIIPCISNRLMCKFRMSNLKEEICDNTVEIDVWQIPSRKVDVLVKCGADALVPSFRQGAVVYLDEVKCRAVPLESGAVAYELYSNYESGNELRLIPCNDYKYCVEERVDNAMFIDGRAFMGRTELYKIRGGLSFVMICEVVKVSREESKGHMVLRVRDATRTKIITKKYDFDNLSQSNEEPSVDDVHSREVDVLVTSPPQNLSDLTNKIIKLGIVRCDQVSPGATDCKVKRLYTLSVEASLPSLILNVLEEDLLVCQNLRNKLYNTEHKKQKRRKRTRDDEATGSQS
ncbi:uncharacterized protein LOC135115969 isoform X2 [Scylla paramamosain]|uniref:uncharacterized protein LOC135115969 isoform X2 n=1 Tax=Scylla paramamosain TaxID=85552 RepID=UPI003082FB2E